MIAPNTRPDPEAHEPRWYALYTRARHEKKVDALLRERGFDVYLPLIPRERQWHDRKKVVHWPLFPSYVFARFARAGAYRVLGTPGVASVVRMAGAPVPIPESEIENVRRLAEGITEGGFAPEPAPWVEAGQHVRITEEPLRGVEGVVLEVRGAKRALVQVGVRAIGQGVKLELDVAALQAIDGSGRVGR